MRICEVMERSFSNEITNIHSGQMDAVLTVHDNGVLLGFLEYTVYENIPSISMIEVKEKRQKVGSSLIKELQRMYPTEEIEWGMTTDEGETLRKSFNYKKIKTEFYDLFKEYDTVSQRVNDIRNELEPLWDNVTSDNRDHIKKLAKSLEELSDRQWDIEGEINNEKPYKYIITD